MSVTEKSPDAFRTIGEAAEELEVPAHVLRFWESKFPQISPLKRAGGRRFYRPADLALLRGIKRLLYEDGFTIRGARKFIADNGVAALLDPATHSVTREPVAVDAADSEAPASPPRPPLPPGEPERGIADVLRDLEEARAKLKSVLEPR
ncbi:MerR family transcriptional regulator [Maricaulis salignorans]|uniref:MerR HTH family regulatory protein n=1 Tax=Maricaulis salignorans TaxID=144026 RepID=A0A1G9PAW5_9PROT|nr:MerR family transcriptional regulator [Maricaulis salignorans]SDL95305.1 MerR HTH family regulatory protein [Maricaulis salignorans]